MASILILFHSQEYGNTAAMAKAVLEGAQAEGGDVQLVNTNEQRMGIDLYRKMDAVAFGTPDYYSYIAGGLKVFLDDYHIEKKKDPTGLTDKPYALFLSHGGGGSARGPLEKLFARMGRQVGETVESRGAPDETTRQKCVELGRLLAQAAGS